MYTSARTIFSLLAKRGLSLVDHQPVRPRSSPKRPSARVQYARIRTRRANTNDVLLFRSARLVLASSRDGGVPSPALSDRRGRWSPSTGRRPDVVSPTSTRTSRFGFVVLSFYSNSFTIGIRLLRFSVTPIVWRRASPPIAHAIEAYERTHAEETHGRLLLTTRRPYLLTRFRSSN